jgi:hypothetical protein
MNIFRTWLVALAMIGCSAASADPQADAILAQAKLAMGGSAWDTVHLVRLQAHAQASGLSGPSEAFEDAASGAYVNRYQLGDFKGADGFDGKTVWSQDNAGQVSVQGGDDARQGAADSAFRAMRAFWYRDRMPAEIAYAGRKSEGDRAFDVIRMLPRGGRPFDMWIDAESHLIDRIVERTAEDIQTTFFSDYRRVDGRLVPFSWRISNGNARYDSIVKVDGVQFDGAVDARTFAPPPPPGRDFGFIDPQKAITVPFKLVNNHIYINVKLNGRGPYEMLLDTGAENVITPTLARELGLKLQGTFEGGGTGEKSVDVAVTSIDRVTIGGAFLDHQLFASSALESFGNVEGKPFVGIIGYELFKRFVVRTDFEKQRLTLIEPEGFAYHGTGTRLRFQLKGTMPIVPGTVDGLAGTFQIDTGSRLTLELMAPFVAKNGLVARYRATVEGVDAWGVGGPEKSWIVRPDKLTLGDVAVNAPVTGLSQSSRGSGADQYISGNVGTGLLRKFNILWDYPRNQIFLERNGYYYDRDVFNRAGVWVNADGQTFVVLDVYEGSPAAEAGLRSGDHILAIGGKRAQTELSLPDFRALICEAPGTKLLLEIDRGGVRKSITVTLRDLV